MREGGGEKEKKKTKKWLDISSALIPVKILWNRKMKSFKAVQQLGGDIWIDISMQIYSKHDDGAHGKDTMGRVP